MFLFWPCPLSQQVDRIYGRALSVLRSSAQMHVFVAEYVRHYKPNRQLELLHLAAAEVRDQCFFRIGWSLQACH